MLAAFGAVFYLGYRAGNGSFGSPPWQPDITTPVVVERLIPCNNTLRDPQPGVTQGRSNRAGPVVMPRISPVTTILLRECAGTALATAAFAYSGWITAVTTTDLLTHLTRPEQLQVELHGLFAALNCLTWWAGVGGLRLAEWRATWPVAVGLALTAVSAIKVVAVGVTGHYA
ncbi:hypothetical protein IL38_22515 [Actinopolyspora erythraea]|uniref:DUF2231 domain-containing protein n=3 Tax=Actinopolyspora erythraea TaxID=414996 RepID=A0ABR4WYY5_9ACTN|nr:hypothetical protein IL38_22515 [Actinopolyspora erythraea]